MSEEYAIRERMARGKVMLKPRGVSDGGNVLTLGHVDMWHHYLDFLQDVGMLGPEPAAARRHDDGLSFYELWVKTHPSQKSNIRDSVRGGQPGERPVHAADLHTAEACLETEWMLCCRYLGAKRLQLLTLYCLEASPPAAPVTMGKAPLPPVVEDFKNDPEGLGLAQLAFETDMETFQRLRAKHDMQESLVKAHMTAFRLVCPSVLDALDVLRDAMERAHEEAWCGYAKE